MPIGRPCRGSGGRSCPSGAIVTVGWRCSDCERAENGRQANPIYDSAWRRLAKRIIAAHIREHGPWCPGDPPEHDAHPSFDLTLDHGDQAGVATKLLDRSRLMVICRSWNAVLGAKETLRGGGSPRLADRPNYPRPDFREGYS